MTHDPVKVVAILYGAAYEYEGPPDSFAKSIPWATRLYDTSVDAEHCGDCTTVPMTCNRCVIDEWRATATAFIVELAKARLAIVPTKATKAMITAAWPYMVAPGDATVRAAWGAQLAAWSRHGNAGKDG